MIRKRLVLSLSILPLCLLLVAPVQAKIIADKKNKVYHRESCPDIKKISERQIRIFEAEPEAESRGYLACEKCVPPVAPPSLKDKELKKLSSPIGREKTYIGDLTKKTYHLDWCPVIGEIAEKDKKQFQSAKAALDAGYDPCKECNPPAKFVRNPVTTGPIEAVKSMEKRKGAEDTTTLPGEEAPQ